MLLAPSIVIALILIIIISVIVHFDALEMKAAMEYRMEEERLKREMKKVSNSSLTEIQKYYLTRYYSDELRKHKETKPKSID